MSADQGYHLIVITEHDQRVASTIITDADASQAVALAASDYEAMGARIKQVIGCYRVPPSYSVRGN